jgi:two-component system, sensor histidine kinase and response regulator
MSAVVASAPLAEPEPTSARRVLVVEDDPAVGIALAQAFERDGEARSTIAGTAGDALAEAKQQPPDLVLLDLNLPDMHGLAAVRELRHHPATADVPILVVSADDSLLMRARALEAEADGYLVKPVLATEVIACARALWRARRRDTQRSELEILRAWSSFLAHDIANGLTAVLSNVQYVAENVDRHGPLWEALRDAHVQGMSVVGLSRDLIDTSRLQSGRLAPRTGRVALHDVAREVAREVDPLSREACRTVRVEGAGIADADADLVRRVIRNLVDNACKHAPRSTAVVAILPQGDWLRVVVRDQGPGVSPDFRKRIRTPVPELLASSQGGHGLGLAFCKLVVAAHGGTLGVDDAPGGGTAVWFTLPSSDSSSGRP